ncbi:hypothetical protein MPTK1_2g17690 [Marchantia polymorpha subsp. ruderalis]|nr:hypothetical protein MARPO_0094s0037 [Marchantia polymorpha]BBN02737.1 hypothetical protein Mp_2g17690 [Marchantia polymorpha subsp. ruderalis]|eukprot:PTQ32863.1 hypothetical protein MARPO_0094s0037 [Marchantia polymorpha]
MILPSKQPAAFVLAAMFVLSSLSPAALGGILEEFSSGFCLNAPNVTKCPSPPTFDLVDITAFGGKWYEIGSSARFKLTKEAGMACSQTNYTVMTSTSFWGPRTANMSFLDKGVNAVGNVAQFGVQQIAGAARGLCQNARDICKMLNSGSQIDQALTLVATAAGKIFLFHPTESATLNAVRASVGTAISAVNVALDSLSKNVTQIQYLDSQLSQANGTLKDNLSRLLNLTLKAGRVQDDIQSAVRALADARGKIIQVAAKLVVAGGADLPIKAVPDLGQAVFLLAAAENAILALATEVRLATLGVTAVAGLIALDSSKAGGFASANPGVAIQNATFPGRLDAVWASKRAPYLILSVDGFPNQGYNAALIYSCTEVPGAHYKQALFIISRTPTLSQVVVDRFLGVAAFHGISTDCDDPFLYTVQTSPLCLASSTPPPSL